MTVYNDYYSTYENSYAYAGGLAGYISGLKSSATDCSSNATVLSKGANSAYAGGLIGGSNGTIKNCHATGNASAICALTILDSYLANPTTTVGGLIGSQFDGSITDCYASGNVSTSVTYMSFCVIGGLVGNCDGNAKVSGCHASGMVSSEHRGYVTGGGLIGFSDSKTTVSDCYATGDVLANLEIDDAVSKVGGLIGESGGVVSRCYATNKVEGMGNGAGGLSAGETCVGGLIGMLYLSEATVENCYAIGDVRSRKHAGGLIGSTGDYSTVVTNCYSAGNVIGGAAVGGLVGKVDCYQSDPAVISNCFTLGDAETTSIHGDVGTVVGSQSHLEFAKLYYIDSQVLKIDGEVTDYRDEYAPGEGCTATQLSGASFYTGTLGWDSAVWDMSKLDAANGQFPTLGSVK